MKSRIRLLGSLLVAGSACLAVPAAADYRGAAGYEGSTATYKLDVSHDGYPGAYEAARAESQASAEPPTYVVVEAEQGVAREVDGETVIVVQEPEPVAATDVAPPAPRVVAVEQPRFRCPGGIWVDGYWAYGDGQYVWIDGHCVVERVNYVFVHPRWDFYANVWWFVPGYYRPCSVWVGFGYYRPYYWFPPYYRPYYRGYRGVPVHRAAPRRPTVARPAYRPTPRAVTPSPRIPSVERRVPVSHGRSSTVNRLPPTRTRAGSGLPPTRAPSVTRVPPTRGPSVTRVPPTRGPSVTRMPPTRGPSVTRVPPTRAPSVSRAGGGPTLTSTVPRVRPGVVSQPRVNSARTPSSSRSAAARQPMARPPARGFGSRPSLSPSRTNAVRQPSFGGRPSIGRSGGFGRPASAGFGGSRSVPTARSR
jgi:hypothetical protein